MIFQPSKTVPHEVTSIRSQTATLIQTATFTRGQWSLLLDDRGEAGTAQTEEPRRSQNRMVLLYRSRVDHQRFVVGHEKK